NSLRISSAVFFSGDVIELRRLRTSSSPVVRLISRWKSFPMRRIWPTILPIRPMTTGKSFGPMTISATTPITSISVQPRPSIGVISGRGRRPQSQAEKESDVLALSLAHVGVDSRSDALDRLVIVLHALLECLNTRGDFAHHARDLAAAKQQNDDDG